jgi:hypothetical protein
LANEHFSRQHTPQTNKLRLKLKHGKPIRFELNREEPGTGGKNLKDVNGTKFTVETFQSVREDNLFKQTVHSGKCPFGPSKYACSIYFAYGITGISM